MGRDSLQTFREYLQALPEELLENVTEDYVWLSGLPLDRGCQPPDYIQRRECCREECCRRGAPDLYRLAESVIAA